MKLKIWILSLCLLPFLHASNSLALVLAPIENEQHEIESLIKGGLSYLASSQKKETQGLEFFKGEWASTMQMLHSFPGLGLRGKGAPDSNLFTTSSIHLSLSQLYLLFPGDYPQIIPMLQLSMENILLYGEDVENAKVFAFWQKLPPRDHLSHLSNLPHLRRSNNFHMGPTILNLAENIPPDADDSALAYMGLHYHKKIGLMNSELAPPPYYPASIGSVFSEFRDLKRKGFNPFNYVYGLRPYGSTGAFLTWLKKEKSSMRGVIPQKGKIYLPFGVNDVDCVVNANILSALALFGELSTTKGVDKSCSYLKKIIRQGQKGHRYCGMYYPNWYNFFYNVSGAYSHGLDCLEGEIPILVDEIKRTQRSNGSWFSFFNGKDHDSIQATAYALGALLQVGQVEKYHTMDAIQNAVAFLKNEALSGPIQGGHYWKGGIFFSGGTVVRKFVVWRSDAYTTAIILKSLGLYRGLLEQKAR